MCLEVIDKVIFCTVGPNQMTLVDMWRMIHQSKAKVVVMVTNAVESGKVCGKVKITGWSAKIY